MRIGTRTRPTHNSVPLVAVGEKSFFVPFLTKFVEGYRAEGMTSVEGARIPAASHYVVDVVADNLEAVGDPYRTARRPRVKDVR
jgi:hypothetical protein